MLRAIFVAIIILIGLRYSFKGPFYILLFYLWIAYFRPDTWLHWNWVTPIWLSFIVGLSLVITTLFSGAKLRGGFGPLLLASFLVVALTSSLLSPAPAVSWLSFWEMVRISLVCYAIIVHVNTEERLRGVLMAIAFSLGFEGTKQGWATLILSPGVANNNLFEFLGDNNGVAIGMLMIVPLFTALARTSSSRLERWIERFFVVGVLYRAISTYSRGGFLASLVLGAHYLVRSKLKPAAVIGTILVIALIVPALPEEFWARMNTINTATVGTDDLSTSEKYTEDFSSAGRIHFWQVAWEMAVDRPLVGVGLHAYNVVYNQYDFSNGAFGRGRSVHSSWMGMMAETGFIGFGIFVTLFIYGLTTASRARRVAKRNPDLWRLAAYAGAIEGALVVFCLGGAFITFQYNELVWHLFAIAIAADRLVKQAAAAPEVVPVVASPQLNWQSANHSRW